MSDAAFAANDKRIITVASDNVARAWDASTGQELLQLSHRAPVLGIAATRDGSRIATASKDGFVIVWDADGNEVRRLAYSDTASYIAFSDDGSTIFSSARQGTLRLWQLQTGGENYSYWCEGMFLSTVCLSGVWRIITVSSERIASVWELSIGREPHQIFSTSGVELAALSPDGDRLVAVSENMARVWEVESTREVLTVPFPHKISRIAFFENCPRILTLAVDNTVRVAFISKAGKELSRSHTATTR